MLNLMSACGVEPLPKRETWSEDALGALAYIQNRVLQMDYPSFVARAARPGRWRSWDKIGWPIGSDQIEGIDKSVIGRRMKRSGQHWSRPSARGMASLRARRYSRRSPLSFEHLRHATFSTPQF